MKEKHEHSVNPELCSCLWTTPLVRTGIQTQMAMLHDWQLWQPSRYKQVTLRIWNFRAAEHALIDYCYKLFLLCQNHELPWCQNSSINKPKDHAMGFYCVLGSEPWLSDQLAWVGIALAASLLGCGISKVISKRTLLSSTFLSPLQSIWAPLHSTPLQWSLPKMCVGLG